MVQNRNVSRISVRIIVDGKDEAKGELIRFLAPRSVDAILRALPVEGRAMPLNSGIYFEMPLKLGREKAVQTVEMGTIAYWPLASALCIFFDKSKPDKVVNKVGRIITNLVLFRNMRNGTRIRIKK